MYTIIYSAIGIFVLVAISFLFTVLENVRTDRAGKRLAAIRKSLLLKSEWLLQEKTKVNTPVFQRTPNTKLHIFPANGDNPVF